VATSDSSAPSQSQIPVESTLTGWLQSQTARLRRRLSAAEERQLASESREFLTEFLSAYESNQGDQIDTPHWAKVRDFLSALSTSRARAGYSPVETATFVFSLKEPLFQHVFSAYSASPADMERATWRLNTIIDSLGLYTTEVYLKSREEVIRRQQQELLELSTPVVQLWDGIVALPLIGTLDSARTQVVMQNLLEAIVATRSDTAIIDITGVPTVDTLVAQHLLKTVAAARLMGAECIISGIRPQIAQTIIHLGVDLADVMTKSSLADAFTFALRRSGSSIVRSERRAGS